MQNVHRLPTTIQHTLFNFDKSFQMIDIKQLLQSGLFAGLPLAFREHLAADLYANERTFDAGQLIMLAGEPCEVVYMVIHGVVRAYFSSLEGREFVLDYFVSGDLINLDLAISRRPAYLTADALVDTTLAAIPDIQFLAWMRDHPSLTQAVTEHLAQRVQRLSVIVEGLALHTVRTRLARFLLARADGKLPHKTWTQGDIAAHIGTVRDVVGRTLREFAQEGLVRRERDRLVIINRRALELEAMQA